jgi:hypothetical protein
VKSHIWPGSIWGGAALKREIMVGNGSSDKSCSVIRQKAAKMAAFIVFTWRYHKSTGKGFLPNGH